MSSVLVHEVLAALLSHTGDVIQPSYSDKRTIVAYTVSRSLSFITPSERERIEGIVQLGCLHQTLQAFAEPPAASSVLSSSSPSLYLSALRSAVSAVLASYRSTVLHAEQTALTLPSYPLSSLQQSLQPFALLFPAIARTVAAASSLSAPHGCQLLSLLHGEAQTGYPLLAAAYRALQQSLHRVLYTHIEGWCAYGRVHDPHGEFFVSRRPRPAADEQPSSSGDDDRHAEVWEGSTVRTAMIPSYLPLKTVNVIHFIGRAVNVLQLTSAPSAAASALFLTPPFTAFLSGLSTLRASPAFSLSALDALLAPLHAQLTLQLSSALLASSKLEEHLRALHAFVLLSDGSFTHFLLANAEPLLSSSPTPHVSRDLTALLQSTLSASSLASHPQSALLTLSLDSASFHFPKASHASAFHCVGEASASATAVKATRGAAWHAGKMLVEHGWECALTVTWEGRDERRMEETTRVGWGFVLQNDGLALASERRRGHDVDGDAPLHSGLVNSLHLELTARTSPSGVRHEQIALYHFPHPPGNATYPPPPKRLAAVTGHWGLFDGSTRHTITVAYSVESDQPALTASVDGQSPAALLVPLKLSTTLQLDGGRAWLGVVCGGGGGGVEVTDWAFRERLPASQPLLAWRDLRLGYRVHGPLSLILRPSCFERYASLFRFLFDLARCNHHLQQSWHGLGALRGRTPPLPPVVMRLLALRHGLHFFTSTLLHHLYQSIIHPAHAALLTAVRATTDFLVVRRAHDEFLARLVQGCWLRDRVLMQGLRDVTDLAERVLAKLSDGGWEAADAAWVDEEGEEWGRLAGLLFTVWTRKNHVVANHALTHLLLALDFNGRFSAYAIAVGLQRFH